MVSHNQPRYALAVYAVPGAGAVVTPVNPALTAGEIGKQLAVAGANVVITSAEAADKVAACGVARRFVLAEQESAGARPFSELLAGGTPPEPALDPRTALAALPFSSGTTGLAKG